MAVQLTNEDRRAIDLLLNEGVAADGVGAVRMGFTDPVVDEVRNRVRAVSKVLSALSDLPAPEPADDLVARTLRRIEAEGRPIEGIAPTYVRPELLGGEQAPA